MPPRWGGRGKIDGNLGGNAHRSRHALNADTIREMHAAFRQGGREAIDKVTLAGTPIVRVMR